MSGRQMSQTAKYQGAKSLEREMSLPPIVWGTYCPGSQISGRQMSQRQLSGADRRAPNVRQPSVDCESWEQNNCVVTKHDHQDTEKYEIVTDSDVQAVKRLSNIMKGRSSGVLSITSSNIDTIFFKWEWFFQFQASTKTVVAALMAECAQIWHRD